jgi:hypothetical protein
MKGKLNVYVSFFVGNIPAYGHISLVFLTEHTQCCMLNHTSSGDRSSTGWGWHWAWDPTGWWRKCSSIKWELLARALTWVSYVGVGVWLGQQDNGFMLSAY